MADDTKRKRDGNRRYSLLYVCNNCGSSHKFPFVPSYCPICGSQDFRDRNEKARIHLEESIDRLWELAPQIESILNQLIPLRAEYEDNMQLIRAYEKRGIKTDKKKPVLKKLNITEELKEYRKNKKE